MLKTTASAFRPSAPGGISRRRLIGLFAAAITASVALNQDEVAVAASFGDLVANEAVKLKGKQYSYRGAGPSKFNCSGFTWYAAHQASGDKDISKDLGAQWKSGRVGPRIGKKGIKRGDLVFFKGTQGRKKGATHVAISLGGGKIIHAMNPKDDVKISKLKSFRRYYLGARRMNPPTNWPG